MGKAPVAYTGPPAPLRAPGQSRWRTLAVFCLAAAASFALLQLHTVSFERDSQAPRARTSPADEWQDNVWPFRQPTPWDISTDFPAPRKIEYEVRASPCPGFYARVCIQAHC